MGSIFISYRRDDASGQAGRLCDRLADRFGADAVFMDVSDLQPGQDFVSEIERALRASDVLLAVIGPQWAGAAGDEGRRRLDDPEDFVRREIEIALQRGARVIPVLVRGARMPEPSALPEPLRALARRHAIELSDNRWDSDVRELMAALGTVPGGMRIAPVASQPPSGRGARPQGFARDARRGALRLGLGVLGVILVVWLAWLRLTPESITDRPSSGTMPTATRTSDGAGRAPTTPQAPTEVVQPSPGATRYALALPETSEIRFRGVGAEVTYRILAIRLAPRDAASAELAFLVRMHNRGGTGQNFWDSSFRLVAGAHRLEPDSYLNLVVDGHAAREGEVRFAVPATLAAAALEIVHFHADATSVPIDLRARAPIPTDGSTDAFGRPRPVRLVDVVQRLPVRLSAGQRAGVGRATFEVTSAVIERATVERVELLLAIRCTVTRDHFGTNFWSDSVRLVVDGVPRAPDNSVNEVVSGGASKDATFVFSLEQMPAALDLQFFDTGEVGQVPIDLAMAAGSGR